MDQAPYLTLVLPAYNAARFLPRSLDRALEFLAAQPYRSELIVVDDGSRDATLALARAFEPRVRVLSHERNRGKGYAVRRGVLAARGQFVFFTDADLAYGLEAIPRFLRYLDHKEFDLVIGSRDLGESLAVVRPTRLRRIASRVFTSVVSRVVVTGVTDTQCGMKGFRSSAAQLLFSRSRIDRFAFDVELVYIAFKKNLDLKRLPVNLVGSGDGTTVLVAREALSMMRDVLLIKWNHMRGRYD